MSAKDRAQAQAAVEESSFNRRWSNGLMQCLQTEEGRAFLWMLYDRICRVESIDADPGRRSVGIDLAGAAKRASLAHWHLMREENERAGFAVKPSEEAEVAETE